MQTSRHETDILRIVRLTGSSTIAELAEQLSVSDETVRRHIRPLVRKGLVEKVHGAVVVPDRLREPPLERRMQERRAAKQAIAGAVANLVQDGESLILDTGSTTTYVALALRRRTRLSVVTNSTDIARTLAAQSGNRVYLAGGEVNSDNAAAFGAAALAFVRSFRVRHVILSIGAVDPVGGEFLDYHLAEAEFSQAAMGQAERVTVVADHSKFSNKGLVKVCDLDQVHCFVTDQAPPGSFRDALAARHAALVVAEPAGEP